MSEVIEMDHVRLKLTFHREQPFACFPDVLPGIRHPFEPEDTFVKRDMIQRANRTTLSARQRTAQGGEGNFNIVSPQRCTQLQRIAPNAADRVGCHQYLHLP
jgi:hypothetical protein